MKEKFNSFSPFAQAILLFVVGAVSFVLISIVTTLLITTFYPEIPVDNPAVQLELFPSQYMFIHFMPFQLGFLLTPGIVYTYLIRGTEKKISKLSFSTIIWSFLLFVTAFFLLPFFSEINLEITKLFGTYEGLIIAKEASDEQLHSLVGEVGSISFYSALLLIGVVTGIAEEFAFRKFLFQHMLTNTNKLTLSLLSSSFIFALLHFNYIQILPLFSFGLVLGMMYYVSGSIIPGIIMHALNNILNVYWLASDSFPTWMNEIDLKTTIPSTLLLMGLLVYQFKFRKQ